MCLLHPKLNLLISARRRISENFRRARAPDYPSATAKEQKFRRESFGWFLFSVDFREFSKVEENHVGIFAVFLRGRILRHHLMDHGQPVADTHEQSE